MDFSLTPSAIKRLTYLQEKNVFKKGTYFRIAVSGGGCSGFQYSFDFDEQKNDDDKLIDLSPSMQVLIDEASLNLLAGSHLDFVEDLTASMFVIKNPNATASCGCGNSFTI
jgi:iron-sulfur cluster insertion protein